MIREVRANELWEASATCDDGRVVSAQATTRDGAITLCNALRHQHEHNIQYPARRQLRTLLDKYHVEGKLCHTELTEMTVLLSEVVLAHKPQ